MWSGLQINKSKSIWRKSIFTDKTHIGLQLQSNHFPEEWNKFHLSEMCQGTSTLCWDIIHIQIPNKQIHHSVYSHSVLAFWTRISPAEFLDEKMICDKLHTLDLGEAATATVNQKVIQARSSSKTQRERREKRFFHRRPPNCVVYMYVFWKG